MVRDGRGEGNRHRHRKEKSFCGGVDRSRTGLDSESWSLDGRTESERIDKERRGRDGAPAVDVILLVPCAISFFLFQELTEVQSSTRAKK